MLHVHLRLNISKHEDRFLTCFQQEQPVPLASSFSYGTHSVWLCLTGSFPRQMLNFLQASQVLVLSPRTCEQIPPPPPPQHTHAPALNTVVRILEHGTKTRLLLLTKLGILALIYINLVLFVWFSLAFLVPLFRICLWLTCSPSDTTTSPWCHLISVFVLSCRHSGHLYLHALGKLQNSLSDGVPDADHKSGHPAPEAAAVTHHVPSKPQWYSSV